MALLALPVLRKPDFYDSLNSWNNGKISSVRGSVSCVVQPLFSVLDQCCRQKQNKPQKWRGCHWKASRGLTECVKLTRKFSDVWELHSSLGRDGNLEWCLIPCLFSSGAYELLVRFTVSGMCCLLWALNPGRNQLATPITLVPLLHPWTYIAVLVVMGAYSVHSYVRLWTTFFLQESTWQLPQLWKLAHKEELLVIAWFLCVPSLKSVASSTIESYFQVHNSSKCIE